MGFTVRSVCNTSDIKCSHPYGLTTLIVQGQMAFGNMSLPRSLQFHLRRDPVNPNHATYDLHRMALATLTSQIFNLSEQQSKVP